MAHRKRKVSVIVTVKNEEATIDQLLASLEAQTCAPDEVVIVDGGSTDGTLEVLGRFPLRMPLKVVSAPGTNIARGRNLAIASAQGDIIASTDAGVRLPRSWLESLLKPFDGPVDVVSGFFRPDPQNVFEVAMGATVLPELRDINPERFLPSSRSIAFTRRAWERVGGYPEWLDYCEDVVFDLRLREMGFRFAFAPAAEVQFRPRATLRSFFRQYYLYARGDGKAGLWPHRHLIRYSVYILGPLALVAGFWYKRSWLVLALGIAVYLYIPYRRLVPALGPYSWRQRLSAVAWVPVIRLVGDVAKMLGYPVGLWWRLTRRGRYG